MDVRLLDGSLDLGSELGEGRLVQVHAARKAGEVGELVGQTNGATVHVHVVTRMAVDLVDLEDTLASHGDLELVEEVLAEANALSGGGLDGTHGTHSDEDVANGGEGEAL